MDRRLQDELSRWLRQHDGVITGAEARSLGLSPGQQRTLVRSGRWRRLAPTVFVDAGAPRTARARLRAALRAAGPGAVVSHESAAWLWGLVDRPPEMPTVTVPLRRRVRLPWLFAHRTRSQPARSHPSGLPATDPVRTLVDLAAREDDPPGTDRAVTQRRSADARRSGTTKAPTRGCSALASMVDRALSRRLVTVAALERATRPDPGHRRPGTALLRRDLVQRGHLGAPTPSVLESHLGRLLRRAQREHGLPEPRAEVLAGGGNHRIDYAWSEVKLGVEADGYVWHSSERSLLRDHARRNRLQREGWLILAYTWRQITRHPEAVVAEIVGAYRMRRSQHHAGPAPVGGPPTSPR